MTFKYEIGQTLRVKEGMYAGQTFLIEDEDDRAMSSGKRSIPRYRFGRHSFWYYEDQVELAVRKPRKTTKP